MPERDTAVPPEAAHLRAARENPVAALSGGTELAALRELLFGNELNLLADIKKRLDDPALHAREVSTVIAEAVLLRSGKDDRLGRALEPVVEEIVKGALRKNPLDFTSVLFPLMGPAIRRSIAEGFRAMLQSLHKTLEMSFSWKGLRWRLEALRTGKTFSEVVLLHTLVYRVEQIFLIHSETGLVLAHMQGEDVAGEDADMVSAMLTAIQDFAHDCFHSAGQEDLDSLQMGEATIFVERSAKAYLACVVRGTPPLGFRDRLRAALELIAFECADALAHFHGDAAPFVLVSRHLESCLVTQMAADNKPLPLWVKALPVALVLALAGAAGLWRYEAHQHAQAVAHMHGELERGIVALNSEPGIVVYDVQRAQSPPWTVFCMRDEFARPVEHVLREQGLPVGNFLIRGVPFVSYEAPIVARRVQHAIRPPESVDVEFDVGDGTLRLSGTASIDWILQSRRELLSLPGVKQLDMKNLEDPRLQRMRELAQAVESVTVEFPLGKDVPVPADQPKLLGIVENLTELEALGKNAGVSVSVTIYGHTDSLGQEKRNYELSQERAKTLAAMLYARGASIPLTLYGMGAQYAGPSANPREGNQASRRIELKVHLAQMPGAGLDFAGETFPERGR
ncbi:MAG: OmpA family protein [Deltaproteobacteria bacterium]|jgi:OOP family OmpA-OmpF porin|nr:OmpA family protein [Deltaproteobacteria bacterium]